MAAHRTHIWRVLSSLVAAALAVAAPRAVAQPSVAAPAAAAQAPATSPTVTVLKPQDFWGEYAIWGSSGADPSGRHVFFGMTSNDDRGSGSAHLFDLDTTTGLFTDVGDVVSELERLKLRRPGETQMKIHSRIVYGADGRQYFASMDESGEAENGSRLPTWGGHLWRRGPTGRWEHLKATPEALIAVAAGGPYVYALGYFEHVIYQFDTRTSQIRSVRVGSAGGHVSRNFFADARGHVFAPRVTSTPQPTAALVEFDATLVEVASFPLPEYFERGLSDSHGIVGTVPDGSGGWFFTTGKGRLYHQVTAAPTSRVTDEGWMNGKGSIYPASLFRNSSTGTLYSVSMPSNYGASNFEWITRTSDGRVALAAFPYGTSPSFPAASLVYGSMSQDAAGRFYVVGTMNYKPLVLQVTPAR